MSTASQSQNADIPETREPGTSDDNAMLLSASDVTRVEHTFRLPKPFATDLQRALAQTSLRVEKRREEAAALGKKS